MTGGRVQLRLLAQPRRKRVMVLVLGMRGGAAPVGMGDRVKEAGGVRGHGVVALVDGGRLWWVVVEGR